MGSKTALQTHEAFFGCPCHTCSCSFLLCVAELRGTPRTSRCQVDSVFYVGQLVDIYPITKISWSLAKSKYSEGILAILSRDALDDLGFHGQARETFNPKNIRGGDF